MSRITNVVIVYLNDGRVIGPFKNKKSALLWVTTFPNALFEDAEEERHADNNGDYFVAPIEDPATAIRSVPGVEEDDDA